MPPRRKQPARKASLRNQQFPPSPPEPAIEAMDVGASPEDMDMSDDVPLDADGASSEAVGGPEDNGSESDNEQEDEIDVEDNERPEDDEEEQEDELSSASPSPPPKASKVKSSPAKPRLKIKLKLSGAPHNATPTPSDEMPLRPGRKGHPKHVDVESEDDEEDDDSSSSTPYTGPTRMTQRQAALAGMVDSSEHLVLEETVSKRKKHLNETELALKREETARKRKNLTAKKLEDEKIETINRLLKKQTRPRGKKNAPAPAEADEDGEQEGEEASVPAAPTPPPTLFRWISSSRIDGPALSFSVPPSLIPDPSTPQKVQVPYPPTPKPAPKCDVAGCTLPRKYKLVKDPTKGGCGMEHLKALQVS